jgi:hypothetical protein
MTEEVNEVPLPALDAEAEGHADVPRHWAFGESSLLGEAPPMLEFRFKSGAALALSYAWLSRAEFDPATGIELSYGDVVVTVRGRNLAPVFASIVRHTSFTWRCSRSAACAMASVAPMMYL